MNPYPVLEFGDILLKDTGSPFNGYTKLKTGSDVSHSELFVGSQFGHTEAQVITAFPKGGVDYYPLTMDGTVYILRPIVLPDQSAFHWFEKVARGQGYDTLGMLAFFFAQVQGQDNGKQFCSEVIARIFKKGGAALLHPRVDCDAYSPATFKTSPWVKYIWVKEGLPDP